MQLKTNIQSEWYQMINQTFRSLICDMKWRSMPGNQWPSKNNTNKEKKETHLKLVHRVIITKKNHISICNVENFNKVVTKKRENSLCSQISDQCKKPNFPHSFTLSVQKRVGHWYLQTTSVSLTYVQTVHVHQILCIYTVYISLIYYVQTLYV